MVEKHKRDKQGRLMDGVGADAAKTTDREVYDSALSEIGALAVPRMFDSRDPHARLYIANFDGTGNHVRNDPEHATNVARLHLDLLKAQEKDSRIRSDYIEGAGTQDSFISRTLDGATGRSYDYRLERMYERLMTQAKSWVLDDPDADIRLVATGFSRGAEQAAGFLRMVNERGIQDETGRVDIDHAFGRPKTVWTLPALRAPGKTLTSEILFDPVGTGTPNNHDRQPTSSTVSALQITARDERRNAFPSTQILRPGRSPDGRFVGVTVPGAHSDIGGSYHRNGLSTLNYNMAADFLNAHSDVPLVSRLPEPTDPAMYVIHHSEDHMWFYSTSEFRRDGHRDIMGSQASPPHCREEREVIVCAPPDPFDPSLAAQVGPRYSVGMHRDDPHQRVERDVRDPAHPDHAMYRSASVQLLELHVRSGFQLDAGQVERLAVGLVTEARRGGLTAIGDVQFGKELGPQRPSLYAFQYYPGDVDQPGSQTVSIDALKTLQAPLAPAATVEKGTVPNEMGAALLHGRHSQDAAPGRDDPSASMSREEIRSLQHNLNTLGFRGELDAPLMTHGVYGLATRTAVSRFQSANAMEITGKADERTRGAIEIQALIADMHPASNDRSATPFSWPVPDTTFGERACASNAGSLSAIPSRSDPRNQGSPQHGLYNELQRCLPDASQDRLLQFTAACHKNRITADDLSEVHLSHDRLTLSFSGDDPISNRVTVDLNFPPPEAETSIREIHQIDQQRNEAMQQSQQRSNQMAQGFSM